MGDDPKPSLRKIKKVWQSRPTIEGAGVRLSRAFGFHELAQFDPFLLLDDFRSQAPEDFLAGFPWHPHRGIETITYVLDGDVEHQDSLGNGGVISSGDIQWMTAGSGILHQEMPKGNKAGAMEGFQLWANLPAAQKMAAPRYRDVKSAMVPLVQEPGGAQIRVVAGQVGGVRGPVQDVAIDPEYLDVSLPPHSQWKRRFEPGHTVFAYVIDGEGLFESEESGLCPNQTLILYGPGETVRVTTRARPVRFLLVCGRPLGEPIAWRGPIVMNTQEELRQAFEEFEKGTFIKKAG